MFAQSATHVCTFLQNGELTLDQVRPAYGMIDAFHHKSVPGFNIKGFTNLQIIARDAKQLQEEQARVWPC